MIRVEAVFRGAVQGVGFRASTERVARGFAVSGWVRNEADGSVVVVAEGEPMETERFVEAVREAMSRFVRSVDVIRGEPRGERGFSIRR